MIIWTALQNRRMEQRAMIGLIQRVSTARVDIDGATVGSIDSGLLVLAGFQHGDRAGRIPRFVERLLNYREIADEAGRMNKSQREAGGGQLVVPHFTLAADTHYGNRPPPARFRSRPR